MLTHIWGENKGWHNQAKYALSLKRAD